MTLKRKTATAVITKAPTDGSGRFEAVVAGWDIDKDNERFDRKAFDGQNPKVVLGYQHVYNDPGARIGDAFLRPENIGVRASGVFDLGNPLGVATYERLLLPEDDPLALREFSVGFNYKEADVVQGPKGERVYLRASIVEVSVVHSGSQVTQLLSVKDHATPNVGASAGIDPKWDNAVALIRKGMSAANVQLVVYGIAPRSAPAASKSAVREQVDRLAAEVHDEVMRHRAARADSTMRSLAIQSSPDETVVVDKNMRLVAGDRVERDRERADRERAAALERDRVREQERADRERAHAAARDAAPAANRD